MKKELKDNLSVKAEKSPSGHKALEERAAEYDGQLNLDGELDWRGAPVGNEIW